MNKPRLVLTCTAIALSLAACGGGGGGASSGGGSGSNTPPDSASTSSQGFLAYIASLADGMFDSAEPVDVSDFVPPTDGNETSEPAATAIDG